MCNARRNRLQVLAGLCLAVIGAADAQYRGPEPNDGGHGFGPNSGDTPEVSSGSSSSDQSSSGQSDSAVAALVHYQTVHGILGALAFVILFPLGSIFMRLIPGRFAIWVHALTQVAAYALFIAAVGLGIYLIQQMQIPFGGGTLLTYSATQYHPIVGLVVFAFLFFQPTLGMIHHLRFRKLQRRQIWSYLHLWNGRIMITLGIINVGLGLKLAGAPDNIKIAYGIVAGIIWIVWVACALVAAFRRDKAMRPVRRENAQMRRFYLDEEGNKY